VRVALEDDDESGGAVADDRSGSLGIGSLKGTTR
jgi:hypothetical protein